VKSLKFLFIFFISFLLCSCAKSYSSEAIADPYGFFSGLWHGSIFFFSLIGYFIFHDVHIMGDPNTGFSYYLGFILGLVFGSNIFRIR